MEIVKKRSFILAGIFLVFGIAAIVQPKSKAPWRTESWMEQNLPMKVGSYEMIPSQENPMCSYKMPDTSYEALNPYGIVARVFTDEKNRFDTVVVAANDRLSLHDPKDCFPGQSWAITWEKHITLDTKQRDKVNAVAIGLKGERGERIALYTYRGPTGTYNLRNDMFWDWFLSEIKGVKPEGALMRVMTLDEQTPLEDLQAFATDWFDAAYVKSGKIY